METSAHVETEVKIPVQDLAAVRDHLAGAGARRVHAALREENVLFDSASGRLAASGQVLRLRRTDRESILTLKGPARYEGTIKHREELETVVADGEVLTAILYRLDLLPLVRYEKERELWRLGEVDVCLDHTPMGDFVELEGPAADLELAARTLALDPARGVRGSYVTLWEEHRSAHPELPADMVFGS